MLRNKVSSKRAAGVLYLVAGFLSDFSSLLLEGRGLERMTLDQGVSALARITLLRIGPTLLILSGVVTIVENTRRGILCLITGIAFILGLTFWAAPILSWRSAIRLLAVPYGAGFLIASLFVLLVKRRWVLALTGSVLSA